MRVCAMAAKESGFPQLDCHGPERYLCVPELMKFTDAIFALLLLCFILRRLKAGGTDCFGVSASSLLPSDC
ncbi:hypothetical protein Nepgr_018021 [Nepenthes gracilis]|uniref:Uncharacterized protein n=1 Tax=Nepenthes gracilis TaxID=150966 RepID=A0AAD3SSJ1_NEPGR|nr:hypothetical protein Nepgr_018021 [Nepenthes gracilis]